MTQDALVQQYCQQHSTAESELLKQIYRDTYLHVQMPRMISGHLQGQFLAFVSRMVQPQYILEIGTFTGYSAICLAQGLKPQGKLITIEKNEELEDRLRQYFTQANLTQNIDLRIGNATKIIPEIDLTFDLIFIDADKKNNALYYDLVWQKLKLQGFMIIDNVLWHGKVLQPTQDADTKAITDFNLKVCQDDRVVQVMLPLRDGLLLVQKIQP